MKSTTDTLPRIKVLDETLINKIAAGEVIERPSSVVKEMIENSLDARAHNISIELEEGGMKLIAIHDDGVGIAGDDLELAFTRHATSKIGKSDDLFNIRSFGFRGEALPSIGSVAHVRAVSRFTGRNSGSEIEIEGGKFLGLKAAGCPPGTSIYVSNLFYNTPARRKFLKTPGSELTRITEMVISYAIGNFGIGFKLAHNGRQLFNYSPDKSLADRLSAIYGFDNTDNFLPFPGTEEGRYDQSGSVLGYITRPEFARTRAGESRFFVNFRPIISRMMMAALKQGYQDRIRPNYYPPAAIFFNIPPRDIDVNVHPAKTEIRFKSESELFVKLKRLVEHTLGTAGILTELSVQSKNESIPASSSHSEVYQGIRNVGYRRGMQESLYKGGFISQEVDNRAKPETQISIEDSKDKFQRHELYTDLVSPKMWQFKDSFIVVPLKDSLLFIDQHNAHERILYEDAVKRLNSGKSSTQQLLFPITVDLTPGEFSRWHEFSDIAKRLGFEIEEFGGTSVIISGIPAGMDDTSPELTLRKILDDFPVDGGVKSDLHRNAAASFACHAAIKAGQKLCPEEMNLLCDNLFACEEFNICPHGRPITARLTIDEIEKKFQRHIPDK